MQQIQNHIRELNHKIQIKQKEIIFEQDNKKRNSLKKQLTVLELKKEIAVIKKRIKQIELN